MRARVMRHKAESSLPTLIFRCHVHCSRPVKCSYHWIRRERGSLDKQQSCQSSRFHHTRFSLINLTKFIFLERLKPFAKLNVRRGVSRRSRRMGATFQLLPGLQLPWDSRLFGFLDMLISKYLWYPFIVLKTLQGVYTATAFVFSVPRVRTLYYNFFSGKTRKEHRAFGWRRNYAATVKFSLNNKYN